MPKIKHGDLLGSDEVCRLYDIDRSTLNRWIKSGRIVPVAKLPGRTGAYVFDRNTIPVPKKAS